MRLLPPLTAAFVLALSGLVSTSHPAMAATASPTESEVLARIRPPVFAERDFPVTDFGGVVGEDVSGAIGSAINACQAAGGGRVVIPAGEWKTGPIHLKSGVNLHVSKGATLLFSTEPARYLPHVLTRFEGMELMNYSPLIYAFEQENIAVTGEGILDGCGAWENWWLWKKREKGGSNMQEKARLKLADQVEKVVPVAERVYGEGGYLRPNFVQPYRCRNVLIEGVTLRRSPMWVLNPVFCENVTVRGVKILCDGPNNDGCDPESSKDVLVENCVFETGDDCIAIKSGRNNDGRKYGVPSENIIIRNCEMRDGHGGVTIGSEISGGVRNVWVSNCKMDSHNLDRAFRFKSNAQRGGVLENIFFKDITIGQVAKSVFSVEFDYEEGAKGPHQPVLRNVLMENVVSEKSRQVMSVRGIPGGVIEGIRWKNGALKGVEVPDVLRHAGTISFEDVSVEPAKAK